MGSVSEQTLAAILIVFRVNSSTQALCLTYAALILRKVAAHRFCRRSKAMEAGATASTFRNAKERIKRHRITAHTQRGACERGPVCCSRLRRAIFSLPGPSAPLDLPIRNESTVHAISRSTLMQLLSNLSSFSNPCVRCDVFSNPFASRGVLKNGLFTEPEFSMPGSNGWLGSLIDLQVKPSPLGFSCLRCPIG